jgi:tetratricopeptide (TPR) repeat protein
VFTARLKQGDLLRRLNQFGPAQQVYEFLLNNYAQNAGVLSAEMALAACHRAQVGPADVSHFESAATIYERIQELPAASVDMRVEASFQLGDLYASRGKADDLVRARDVWWMLTTTFLLDDAQAAQLGVQGRYWMARGLLRLGDLYAQQQKLEQARNAYDLILRKNLPFAKLARESFVRVGGKP